jgi:hypothetical protein
MCRVNVTRFLAQGYGKITRLTFYIHDMGIGQDFDIWVLIVLDIGWGNGRPRAAIAVIGGAPAEHAIVLREHIAKLGDPASQAGRLFNKIDFQPSVSQIQCCAHTPNPAANYQGRGGFTTDYPGFDHLHECLPSGEPGCEISPLSL